MVTVLVYAASLALWFCFILFTDQAWYTPSSSLAFILCTGVALLGIPDLFVIPIKSRKIDPRHWYFDPMTGERHRITTVNIDGFLYDGSTYRDRVGQRVWRREQMNEAKAATGFMGLITAGGFIYVEYGGPQILYVMDYIGLFHYACFLLMALGAQMEHEDAVIGLPPVAPNGRELIDQEKVYGIGGFGDLGELDFAARGNASRASSRLPIFDD